MKTIDFYKLDLGTKALFKSILLIKCQSQLQTIGEAGMPNKELLKLRITWKPNK